MINILVLIFSNMIFLIFAFFMFFIDVTRIIPGETLTKLPRELSRDYITFTTVPLPLKTEKQFIKMQLIVSNWLLSSPSSKVVFIINESEFDTDRTFMKAVEKDFGPNRLIYDTNWIANYRNYPLINEWFINTLKLNNSNIVALINSDILLPKGFNNKIMKILDILGNTGFITSFRYDFDAEDSEVRDLKRYFRNQQLNDQIESLFKKGNPTEYTHRGMDLFLFRTDPSPFDPSKMPPFIMGAPDWDNYVMGEVNYKLNTATMGEQFRLLHINHPMSKARKKDINVYNRRLRLFTWKYNGDNRMTKFMMINSTLVQCASKKRIELY